MRLTRLFWAAGMIAGTVACSSETGDDEANADGSGGNAAGGATSSTGGVSLTGGGSALGTGGQSGSGTGGAGTGGTEPAVTGGTAGGLTVPGRDQCFGMPFDEEGLAGGGGVCAGYNAGVEALPVDLYMIMDRTSSMNEPLGDSGLTRWETITQAMQQLVSLEEVQSTRLGLQFFSLTASINEAVECDPASYANPAVEIGPISQTGSQITAAIEDMTQWVGGLTPTYAALQGALQHAIDHKSRTGRAAAVVLVTDGLPTQCEEQSVAAIADLAGQARAQADVLTFAIGLSIGRWNLDQIARMGGTLDPYIIDGGDGVEQFVNTIRSISATPFPCEFLIPDPPDITQDIDYDKVQVLYWPENNGAPEEIPRISSPSLCEQSPYGGWYYDSESNPTTIRVCECVCNRFGRGVAEVRFGCRPHVFIGV